MSRPYEILSGDSNFQDFIYDLLHQMSLEKEDLEILFDPKLENKVIHEFAKCFVTAKADPEYNYEVYELVGDVCVNSSIVIYLHRIIQSTQERQLKQNPAFLPDPRIKDYFNKLKSKYISNQQYKYFAVKLGFNNFLYYHPDDIKEINENKEVKFIPSAFEAFFGCFEFIMTKYIPSKYSHTFVANFISYLMHSHEITYHPDNLYDPITLLKETGDKTRPPNRIGFLYEVMDTQNEAFVQKKTYNQDGKDVKPSTERVFAFGSVRTSSEITQKDAKINMCRIALQYIKLNHDKLKIDVNQIKSAPTPEELGISELCKV